MYFIFVMAFPRDHAQVLLFNIYSSKLFDIVGRHLPKVHCYADDSQLYLSFNPSCAFSQDEAIRSMETSVSHIEQQMTSTNLCLMTTKPNLLEQPHDIYKKRLLLTLSGQEIAMQQSFCCAVRGSMINLLWPLTHQQDVQCCFSSLAQHQRRIRKYLFMDAAATLIHSFVSSRIDYCNRL